MPAATARCASVPMTSSASTPGIRSSGRPSASTAAISGSTWLRRSSGIGARCALYSANRSSRKVRPGRVEDDGDELGVLLAQHAQQHVEHAEHGAGRLAARVASAAAARERRGTGTTSRRPAPACERHPPRDVARIAARQRRRRLAFVVGLAGCRGGRGRRRAARRSPGTWVGRSG